MRSVPELQREVKTTPTLKPRLSDGFVDVLAAVVIPRRCITFNPWFQGYVIFLQNQAKEKSF